MKTVGEENLSDIVEILLENRGLIEKEEKEKFLSPSWDRDLLNPFHMKDMDKAVERIYKAIKNGEKIVIYSDYDCDGIPGAVILHDFFKKIETSQKLLVKDDFKIDFHNYIPHRHKEGYGINMEACKRFVKDKVSLIITVDLGITNNKEIDFLQEAGIDVVLTDHHLPILDQNNNQIIPKAFVVINNKRQDSRYQDKMLCGCATAWKLANAFLMKHRIEFNIPEGYEKWWLDMVAISTVSDMVPLINENRLLAKYGLEVLRKSKRTGLLEMLKNAKIKQKDINEIDIGFGIAPRINSASRMSDPIEAFHALIDNKNSVEYALLLEKNNKNRKTETVIAQEMVDLDNFSKDNVILVGEISWNPGILGLIASKIVDKTKKTTFVYGGLEDEVVKGSVRAGSDGANVVQLMSECSDLLEAYGGHEEAGGFSVKLENIKEFHKKLQEKYKKLEVNYIKKESSPKAEIKIKAEDINLNFYKNLQKLAPFGVGNQNPIFEISGENKGFRIFGDKGQHIEVSFSGISAVKFNVDIENIESYKKVNCFLGQVEWDSFKNKPRIKLL